MATQYDADVMKRLRRIEGQIRGIQKMMAENKECKEVVTQLAAARGALDRVIGYVTAVNLEQCILQEQQQGGDTRKLVQQAVELLMKSK